MAFRTFADAAEAAAYAASLDERWPDRALLKAHLSAQLNLPSREPAHVVEFCAGAGALAARLLADYPMLHYTAIDVSTTLLDVARANLAQYAGRTTWVEADLNEEEWLMQLPPQVDAFVSLQSLHDLGDEGAVARIMALASAWLPVGGRLVYADLLADPINNTNPGRMTVERHLELLAAAGFATSSCTLTLGPFGCFRAEKI